MRLSIVMPTGTTIGVSVVITVITIFVVICFHRKIRNIDKDQAKHNCAIHTIEERFNEISANASKEGTDIAHVIEEDAAVWLNYDFCNPPLVNLHDVPIIDVTSMRLGEPDAVERLASTFSHAVFETGFYLLKGHGVPMDLQDRMYEHMKAFFNLPLETKMQYGYTEKGVGYVPLGTRIAPRRMKGNMVEIMYYKRDNGPRQLSWDNQDWPRTPEDVASDYKQTMIEYSEALDAMANKYLLPLYEKVLDLPPGFFAEAFANGDSYLRLKTCHQPDVAHEDGQFSIAPHVDTSFITILSRKETSPGLFVFTYENKWKAIPQPLGCLTINNGQLLHQWTNGRAKASRHFAKTHGKGERYSIPMFYHPHTEHVMDPRDIPSCCPKGEEPRFPAMSYMTSQAIAQGE